MSELYSKNQLINPSFEIGNVTGWTITGSWPVGENPQVVFGGTDGDYTLQVSAFWALGAEKTDIRVYQQVAILRTPDDVKIQGDFLPGEDSPGGWYDIPAMIRVVLRYSDDTLDIAKFPCRDDSGEGLI